MNDLYNALETCLQAIEEGQKLESVLARYPDFEKELRPILEVSLLARNSGRFVISGAVKHRGRVRLLQHVNEIRKTNNSPSRRRMSFIPQMIMVLGLVGIFVLASTGIVSASSGTLPGDQLYPVKRTWEGVRLFFAYNTKERSLLESQFEQERLDEIGGLLGKGIAAPIEFTGLVTTQTDGRLKVSGIPVSVTNSTNSPASGIPNGAPVIVIGLTRSDGVVEAHAVQLLQPGGALPPLRPSENDDSISNRDNEGGKSVQAPVIIVTPSLTASEPQIPTQEPKTYQFSGVVQSIQKDQWVINGQTVFMDQAEVVSAIKVGSVVTFDGTYATDGRFVVTKVEEKSSDNTNKPHNDTGGNFSGNSGSGSGNSGNSGNGSDNPGGGSGKSGSGSDNPNGGSGKSGNGSDNPGGGSGKSGNGSDNPGSGSGGQGGSSGGDGGNSEGGGN